MIGSKTWQQPPKPDNLGPPPHGQRGSTKETVYLHKRAIEGQANLAKSLVDALVNKGFTRQEAVQMVKIPYVERSR